MIHPLLKQNFFLSIILNSQAELQKSKIPSFFKTKFEQIVIHLGNLFTDKSIVLIISVILGIPPRLNALDLLLYNRFKNLLELIVIVHVQVGLSIWLVLVGPISELHFHS